MVARGAETLYDMPCVFPSVCALHVVIVDRRVMCSHGMRGGSHVSQAVSDVFEPYPVFTSRGK